MSDGWPEGWSRGDPRGAHDERTAVYPQGSYGADPYRQPYGQGGPPPAGPAGGRVYGRGRGRRRRWPKILITVIVVIIVLIAALLVWLDLSLNRVNALEDYSGRIDDTPGTNWLLIGTDSRKGLDASQRKKLATGKAAGQRTDTMMMLHIPEGSNKPTLVSLPRDSWVPIPGHGYNKLNAAFSIGGPQLLVKTIEKVTDVRMDHYMEINFAGFVDVVDAVGGVDICVKSHIKDPKAGIDLKKGCQDMDGGTALGYVRTRATGAIPDFERTQRQRQFFSAVVQKAASPGTLINPFTSIPLALSAADSVAVDPGTGLFDLLSVGLAMREGPLATAVPIGSLPTIGGQAVVKWDTQKALRLFEALAADKQVPKDVITN